VVAVGRTRGRTRSGGVAFDLAVVHVWTVLETRIARLEVYIDTPAMGQALGARRPAGRSVPPPAP
jgi:ketosteroid isomerase-like protein